MKLKPSAYLFGKFKMFVVFITCVCPAYAQLMRSLSCRLMETYDMRSMFTLNMEGLQLRLYQFSCLLSQILPTLHTHLHLHGIHSGMFASQWFLSLFAYTYPLPLVFRIYDVVFAEGAPETIMRVAIALLKKNEEKLLELGEFEDLLDFL